MGARRPVSFEGAPRRAALFVVMCVLTFVCVLCTLITVKIRSKVRGFTAVCTV